MYKQLYPSQLRFKKLHYFYKDGLDIKWPLKVDMPLNK